MMRDPEVFAKRQYENYSCAKTFYGHRQSFVIDDTTFDLKNLEHELCFWTYENRKLHRHPNEYDNLIPS